MSGGDNSLDQLIAGVERGLLVTRFWYIRPVDPRTILFTGLTRDGTFLIEKGKVTRAVKNLRFNESPIFMLNNLEAMGKPERVSSSESGNAGPAIMVPAIRCRDFNFTSLSEAVCLSAGNLRPVFHLTPRSCLIPRSANFSVRSC
jgi:predicted Zn-dependent protease